MIGFLYQLFKSQLFTSIPSPKSEFSSQTVIVTGSNTGLGLEAARHLVRLGAKKVILAVRTISKGEVAARNILESTGAKENVIEVWPLDLSNFESVKAFGARVQTLDRLDALIQNAGILTTQFKLAERMEGHITINVVSATLIGLLSLPKLKETSQKFGVRTRLSFVGSDLHYIAKFKEADTSGSLIDALSNKDHADIDGRYALSKLLLLYTVRELTARNPITPQSNVVINCQTPGACKSELFRDDMSWMLAMLQSVVLVIFARTTEVGARTLVDAVRPDIENAAHGAFLMDCKIFPNGSNVDSPKGQRNQQRWIDELFPLLESISPGCTKVLSA